MLRRLSKDEVRLGMYIHRLEGGWLDHPFWRNQFLLDDPADLAAIRESGLSGVVVDDERGRAAMPSRLAAIRALCDAEAPAPVVEEVPPPVAPPPKPAPRPTPTIIRPVERCTTVQEIGRAQETIDRSKRTVSDLLRQARLGKAVEIAKTMPVVEDIAASVDRNPHALVSISRMRDKDEYTYLHSIAVCALMVNLGRQLGLEADAVREAGLAGLLHDFGKVAVPESLLKKPDSLTDKELTLVREHALRGHQLIRATGAYSDTVADVALHHHERIDGSGYPHGLKGQAISRTARMAAVCDVYDAITSQRPYRKPSGPAESLSNMFRSNGQFDDQVLAGFVRSVGVYPVGTLVRLESERLALVIDQGRGDTLRPLVRAFYCIRSRARIAAHDIDLARADAGEGIVSREEPRKWGFANWETHWTALIRGKA